jgi:hypothetical protein
MKEREQEFILVLRHAALADEAASANLRSIG